MDGLPKFHRTEVIILGAVAFVLIALLGIWIVVRTAKPDRLPVEEVTVQWRLEPGWRPPPPAKPVVQAKARGGELAIYVDRSVPMVGFLAPAGSEQRSGLKTVLQLLPDHLVRIDGAASSHLGWHSVAATTERLRAVPNLDASFYTGAESRLDLAVAEILSTLERDTAEAAVLVTDLIATGELTGAQGVAQPLADWVHSPVVLSGDFDLGLLGVRAPYWGVRNRPGCGGGPVGCWFSEQGQRFLPLPELRQMPFYVLVFARGPGAAKMVGEGLREELTTLGLTSEWELLSEATTAKEPKPTRCVVRERDEPERQQFALFASEPGRFRCESSETVLLQCELPEAVATVEPIAGGNPDTVEVSTEEGAFNVELDCRAQRRQASEFALELSLRGKPTPPAADPWAGWSSVTDDEPANLGKTLRLRLFVERLRLQPDYYTLHATLVAPESTDGR